MAGGTATRVFARREHDGDAGVAHFGEIGILRHVLLFVGGNGPRAEVVDLLVHVIADGRNILCGPAASRMRESFAMALRCPAAAIYCFDILVVQNDRRGVLGIVRRLGLVGFDSPVGHRQIFIEDAG